MVILSPSPELNGTINPGEENKKSYLTMKKFLQSLQDIQDECIDEVKKSKASQLPGAVAGVTIHSVGQQVSREEWNQIRENISEHSKEWQKFKKDPNKIILEKNFFINCLNFMQAFYIFRPTDDYGNTYIRISDSFFKSKPKSSPPYFFITFLVIACILILASLYYISWLFIPGIFFILLGLLVQKPRDKKQKIKEEEWLKSFTNRPRAILPPSVFSKKYSQFANLVFAKQGGAIIDKNTRASIVKINLTSSPFFSDYKATLSKTLEIARQNKGDIIWLWQFGPYTISGDDFSVTYQHFNDRHLDQELHINLDIKTSNILPAIETEHSFIFCLDYFSDEMEKYYAIPDGIIETLRKRTKNSSGTTINDDLFRLNEI